VKSGSTFRSPSRRNFDSMERRVNWILLVN